MSPALIVILPQYSHCLPVKIKFFLFSPISIIFSFFTGNTLVPTCALTSPVFILYTFLRSQFGPYSSPPRLPPLPFPFLFPPTPHPPSKSPSYWAFTVENISRIRFVSKHILIPFLSQNFILILCIFMLNYPIMSLCNRKYLFTLTGIQISVISSDYKSVFKCFFFSRTWITFTFSKSTQ